MRKPAPTAVVVAALLVVAVLALAANAGAGPRGYFACTVLLFFAPCSAIEDAPEDASPVPARSSRSGAAPTEAAPSWVESLWAEPRSRGEAGGQIYVPPGPVREFLEAPTPDRARAYLPGTKSACERSRGLPRCCAWSRQARRQATVRRPRRRRAPPRAAPRRLQASVGPRRRSQARTCGLGDWPF